MREPVDGRSTCSPDKAGRSVASVGFAPGPPDIDRQAAACAQSGDAPRGPCGRQRREKIDSSIVALQQHFGHGRGASEVAVDLKYPGFAGRVGVEQVGAGGVLEQHAYGFPGLLAIQEAGPEVDGPGAAPARIGAARGQPAFKRNARPLPELAIAPRGEFVARDIADTCGTCGAGPECSRRNRATIPEAARACRSGRG
jgi:hypothetical protein